jgi:hypothetical protein
MASVVLGLQHGPGTLKHVHAESRQPAFLVVSKESRSVAAALDKRVRIFDADTFKQVAEMPEAPDWVNNALSFSADGRWLATRQRWPGPDLVG